jgi:uncharacterized tellurite resistance protein B-like protein
MGLLTKLFCDASDSEFKLAKDLVAMAIADGKITEEERKMINDICQKEGIAPEVLNERLLGFDGDSDKRAPQNRFDKNSYLAKLIKVMGIDGNSAHMEIYLLEIIAAKMGLSHLQVVALVLTNATRKNFPGDTGAKVLSSFLRNVIDPKSKSLQNNKENIRKVFDDIARNTPVLGNPEEDRTAFVQAMTNAVNLLMENTILLNEFRTMGLDHETILMDEREQAIRRWLQSGRSY